ncbi:hypothetical protein DDZ13_11860 [Coraliomargarita sinensis]|uniref:LamG-like jellyroll fold domain-containing protein n=2 Tax=Coraliomargarita sinensis TaxID=2174842 RepID=A0A317ZDK7_9BACT|nr:hypothetical protein DDZ13_11860 [Coraliomargarita sinensis]
MKLYSTIVLASALAGFTCSINAELVAYFPIDSTTDTSTFIDDVIDDATHAISDGTGNNNTGSIVFDSTRGGDVISTVQGHRYSAGTQDIDLTEGFTWSFWFKSPSLDFHDSDSSNGDTIIGTRSDSGQTWHKVQPKSVERWSSFGGYSVDTGNWHHVAYTGAGTGASATFNLWVDGVNVATDTGATFDSLATYNNNFEIGGSGKFSEDVQGLIDDIAVWNEVLSDQRIIDLSNGAAVVPEPSTLALIGLASLALFIRRLRA